jgi:hypothetical protein
LLLFELVARIMLRTLQTGPVAIALEFDNGLLLATIGVLEGVSPSVQFDPQTFLVGIVV